MSTNATETQVAEALEGIGSSDQGTLVFIHVRKKGVERGPSGARTVYGDDEVAVLIWSGFDYGALVDRSQRKLDALRLEGHLVSRLAGAVSDENDIESASYAICEIEDHFARIGNGVSRGWDDEGEQEDDKRVWEPLVVNGTQVRGARVYRGRARPEPRSPKPGQVYILGVKLGEKVLKPAAHGRWKAASSSKTLAKQVLKSWLPIGLFCQYTLDPEGLLAPIKVAKEASAAAIAAGVHVDPEAVRSLFRIA